ncbi:PQQ-binding-like beta-propeller repeat protein [Pedobacter sp. SD-b]|uniref:PQQ-binding-like beta-propeller repeat protein n=1 Tax=Pedobacter segetis TaxID=2793069 RepID=A0ABS1BN10_9SPHI|nr:PQQ-binding-like beta-propeller repeat protein [Pedobacter segetis]MBK0384289.1 PQQ-binding-like beta-propeller repeat protein [Pedobacter segetis]
MNKKIIALSLLLVSSGFAANAQFGKLKDKLGGMVSGKGAKASGNFKSVWESEFSNKATVLAVTGSSGDSYILGTDDNSASVLDGEGKQIWAGDFKNITTNKTNKCDYQYSIWKENGKGGYLFLFDSRKLGTDRIAVLDMATGKELWNSENYQNLLPKDHGQLGSSSEDVETVKYIDELDAFLIAQKDGMNLVKAKTGEKIWETKLIKGAVAEYRYDKEKNEIVMLNYKPTALGALLSGFKNQLLKVNASNGEIVWDASFRGTIEKELVTRKPIIDLWVKGDKVYLWLDGIQVYNLNSGQKLWEVDYENDMAKSSKVPFGGGSRKETYRTLADPLFTDDAVYLVIFATRNKTKYVEKHDIQTGKLLWASEKITGAFSMPKIYKSGDKILLQIGGKVQVQEIEKSTDGGLTYKIYFDYVNQKNSLLALNDKDGTTAWRSERFDKRITDMIIDKDKTVFIGDGDEFYSYDIASGKQLFDVKHSSANVGKAFDVLDYGDNVVVVSEKGLASYKKADGKRNYATDKLKGIDYSYDIGGNFFLRNQTNSKNIIYGINMETGETKGSVESKGKGGSPKFGNGIDISDDGEFIYAFKNKKVEKIKVNN